MAGPGQGAPRAGALTTIRVLLFTSLAICSSTFFCSCFRSEMRAASSSWRQMGRGSVSHDPFPPQLPRPGQGAAPGAQALPVEPGSYLGTLNPQTGKTVQEYSTLTAATAQTGEGLLVIPLCDTETLNVVIATRSHHTTSMQGDCQSEVSTPCMECCL